MASAPDPAGLNTDEPESPELSTRDHKDCATTPKKQLDHNGQELGDDQYPHGVQLFLLAGASIMGLFLISLHQTILATGGTQLRDVFTPEELPGIILAYMHGLKAVFAVGIAMAGVSLLSTAFIPWSRLPRHVLASDDAEKSAT